MVYLLYRLGYLSAVPLLVSDTQTPQVITKFHTYLLTYLLTYLVTYLLALLVPTGTWDLNFTNVQVSIAVKFFTETGLLALCSNPQPGEYPF
jgi:hypothetical protein